MKIAIISTHSFPITGTGTVSHTGDIVIADLCRSLDELNHEVYFCAPEGSYCPPNGKQLPMRASFGKYPPSSQECESEAYYKHADIFRQADIVHDFSVTKQITEILYTQGKRNVIQTLMGGPWTHSYKPHNLVTWSRAHRDRVLRGATDFENTPTPLLAGPNGFPVKDAHVVYGGIDTHFYSPTYEKKDFYLWLGRWHQARGYKFAIDVAKATGIELVMAGEHPDNELFESQKQNCLEAVELAKGVSNVHFEFLPKDPDHHWSKRNLFQQARALIQTTQMNEPGGLSQLESLACGTPVITTNFGSMPEIISNGTTGFVCENNVESFAAAISKMNELKCILDRDCRTEAVKKFDRKVMARAYLLEYENVIKRNGWGA